MLTTLEPELEAVRVAAHGDRQALFLRLLVKLLVGEFLSGFLIAALAAARTARSLA